MKTWSDLIVHIHSRRLPFSVLRFENGGGRMIDLSTGETVAENVEDARRVLEA